MLHCWESDSAIQVLDLWPLLNGIKDFGIPLSFSAGEFVLLCFFTTGSGLFSKTSFTWDWLKQNDPLRLTTSHNPFLD